MKKHLKEALGSTLAQNSYYLLLASFSMAGFGFLFWLLATRMFPASDVGLATTLISVMNVIAMLSLAGFDTVFIRFLPGSSRRNDTMNTGLVTVSGSAMIIAVGFLAFVGVISPVLSFVREGVFLPLFFVLSCVVTALNILTDSIFIANRAAKYTFFINTIFVSIRLGLLVVLARYGVIGIFAAVALSQALGLALSLIALVRRFDYDPETKIDNKILRLVGKYSAGNYIAGVFNLLPATILPVLIANHLGTANAAFYGIAMMIGNLLYAIPWTITRSLFAEGSHSPAELAEHTKKALLLMSISVIPGAIVLSCFGDHLLSFFGRDYSKEGFHLLQLIAVTALGVCSLSLLETYFRVVGNPNWLILINGIFLLTIVVLVYLLLPYGLVGIGVAWLMGHLVASIASYLIPFSRKATVFT